MTANNSNVAAGGETLGEEVQAYATDLASPERSIRTVSLKWLEKSFLKRIDGLDDQEKPSMLVSMLDDCNLGSALLTVLSGDGVEILREKAAIVLKDTLAHNAMMLRSDSVGAFLRKFYVSFGGVFYHRLYTTSSLVGGDKGSRDGNGVSSTESVEEIRLLLLQILSSLLSAMLSHSERCVEEGEGPVTYQPLCWSSSSSPSERKLLMDATSKYCRALPSRVALLDPYPDLKRECCVAIVKLCSLAPLAVQMHSEMLLRPLTVGGGASDGTTSSNHLSLLRHRHAKTRSVALEAGAAIVKSCFRAKSLEAASSSDKEDETGEGATQSVTVGIKESVDETIDAPCRRPGIKDGPVDIIETVVLPSWEECCHDRSASVRHVLISSVFDIAKDVIKSGSICDQEGNGDNACSTSALSPKVMVLLLMGLSDDSHENGKKAMECLEDIASLWWEASNGASALNADTTSNELGSKGVRLEQMIVSFFPCFLRTLLSDASHWATSRRVRALETVGAAIELIPDDAASATASADQTQCSGISVASIEKIMHVLVISVNDDEAVVRNAVSTCAEILGKGNKAGRQALSILTCRLSGRCAVDSGVASPSPSVQNITAALSVLGSLVRGNRDKSSTPGTAHRQCWVYAAQDEICAALASLSVLQFYTDKRTMWALFGVCRALLDTAVSTAFLNTHPVNGGSESSDLQMEKRNYQTSAEKSEKDESQETFASYDEVILEGQYQQNPCVTKFLRCCIQLLGCPASFKLQEPVDELLEAVAERIPLASGKETVLGLHLRDLIKLLESEMYDMGNKGKSCEGKKPWTQEDPQLHAFDALLRHSGGKAVGKNFDVIEMILERHLSSNKSSCSDTDTTHPHHAVKLSMMALLESVVSNSSCPKHLLHPFTANLLEAVIVPNLVWQVGGSASALRKVAVASLYSLLRGGGVTARCLFNSAPHLLPVLKSNISDDDASTRQLVCMSLAMIFELLPGALGEEPVHQLYPQLIMALDDSSDDVRFAACSALTSFLKAAPPSNFKGTAIRCIVEQLLVHMDDPNPKFQQCCLNALKATLTIDCDVVVKKTQEARTAHRQRQYCDSLLQAAHEWLIISKIEGSQ